MQDEISCGGEGHWEEGQGVGGKGGCRRKGRVWREERCRREGRVREGEKVGGRETCISVNTSSCMQ